MSEYEKALSHVAEQIKRYRELSPEDGGQMIECLQQISATLYYLEGVRAKYHDHWQSMVQKQVLAGDTVSRAENNAHVNVPELYKLRKLIDSAYVVCDAIRSQSSWIKMEMNSVK